jgi:SAM-dependent methyltransferase
VDEAGSYHERRYGSWYGTLYGALYREALLCALPVNAGGALALDCATGTGITLEILLHSGFHAFGVDLTPEMLRSCRERLGSQSAVSCACADILRLPFPDGCFDLVTSSRFLHLFPIVNQKRAIAEMARVLKPGGTLIVDFYNRRHWKMLALPIVLYRLLRRSRPAGDTLNDIHEMAGWMRTQGLEVRRTIGISSYLLAFLRLAPSHVALRAGRSFQSGLLRSLAEQVMVVACKTS